MSVMLVSLGGSPEPVIFSIKHNRPGKLVFFASRASRRAVSDSVIPAMLAEGLPVPDHEIVMTPDEQHLGECVRALLVEVPAALRRLGCQSAWPDIIDYTGATKTMASALVWASSKFPCRFSYVGGDSRTKGGVGVVNPGSERMLVLENPWDKMGYFELGDAMLLFNQAQYAPAIDVLAKALQKIPNDSQPFRVASLLAGLFRAYNAWDSFDHAKAWKEFRKNLDPLLPLGDSPSVPASVAAFARESLPLSDILNSISKGKLSSVMIRDLLANARRRARIEQKFDDATARCYSAIEKTAKLELLDSHGVNSSDCRDFNLIPARLRDSFILKHSRPADDTRPQSLQFGLSAQFELLREFGSETADRFWSLPKMKTLLESRNNSILAHGVKPVSAETFEAIFSSILSVIGVSEDELHKFPAFSL